MKTGTQKKPGKDIRTLNETRKIDKKSIIVLVIAALMFFGAFFWLHSDHKGHKRYFFSVQRR